MPTSDPHRDEVEALKHRLEFFERENDRLRQKMEPILGPDNPCFDPRLFTRLLQRRVMLLYLPFVLLAFLPLYAVLLGRPLPGYRLGPVPVLDIAGSASGLPGFGLGIVAVGGFSAGVIALGGMSVGLVALGGGAVGLIAIGGGTAGLIAIGGGAFGVVAVGGNACGRYVLAQRGVGRHVLALNRQDPEAVAMFTRLVPALRRALTTAMPVIPIRRE